MPGRPTPTRTRHPALSVGSIIQADAGSRPTARSPRITTLMRNLSFQVPDSVFLALAEAELIKDPNTHVRIAEQAEAKGQYDRAMGALVMAAILRKVRKEEKRRERHNNRMKEWRDSGRPAP